MTQNRQNNENRKKWSLHRNKVVDTECNSAQNTSKQVSFDENEYDKSYLLIWTKSVHWTDAQPESKLTHVELQGQNGVEIE